MVSRGAVRTGRQWSRLAIATRPLSLIVMLCAASLILSFTMTVVRTDDGRQALPPGVAELLGWLPVDTETVIVAQGPFEFHGMDQNTGPILSFRDQARSLAMHLISFNGDGKLEGKLRQQVVLAAVEGARSFRAAKGFGLAPFAGAQIVRFAPECEKVVSDAFQSLVENAPKTATVCGEKVAVYSRTPEADEWHYHIAYPEAGVLVIATDLPYLEAVLQRRVKRPGDSAFPSELQEWRHVDVTATVWAIRHFRLEDARKDPTSPLNQGRRKEVRDSGAIGFVFWYHDSAKLAKGRYLSRSGEALRVTKQKWISPTDFLEPDIQKVADGVVEISEAIGEDEDEGDGSFLFVLMSQLGHLVYL
jgi:hypothetical protein